MLKSKMLFLAFASSLVAGAAVVSAASSAPELSSAAAAGPCPPRWVWTHCRQCNVSGCRPPGVSPDNFCRTICFPRE
jgi:hypothetical protein